MLKKVFLQTQFGSPHAWTEQYFENVRRLAQFGWSLKVFTPNPWKSEGNIEIIPMTVEEYDGLLLKHCGVSAGNYLKDGVPAKLVSDHYPAFGQIFQDYIQGFDFWSFTNWDVVYGRLDHFVPDTVLESCDVWSDEVNGINGIFTLMRNDPKINNLFRFVPAWERSFTVHEPCAFDEFQMTHAIRALAARGMVRFQHPPYFPFHSYDRLIQHRPKPNLYFENDGALIERYEDRVHFPNEKRCFGREIFLFHFSRTKVYPIE